MSRNTDISNIQSRIYHTFILDSGNISSFKQMMGLVAMKHIDQINYNYKSSSYFHNGRIKIKPFSRRRAHFLGSRYDYGIHSAFTLADEEYGIDQIIIQKRVNAIIRRVRPKIMSNALRGNILGTRRFRHYKYLE